ncbi:serine/threonine-protein kinase [Streptomyces sp. Go-475]|uniref:serine/threonine-protein kinase n=1 Tax=Streptomyces sp. Go-475 TaxID=2072505 RepID=UPI000DEFBFCF|nr:serine/threonine-protein kinase [Streptomyces sp. Go-475]AXE88617.1 Serine/threonine-protein kinase PknH [Streptomyces sp. Go-475]
MDGARALLADYGQWAKNDTASDAERYETLAELVAALLNQVVDDGAVQRVDLEGLPGLGFEYEGRDYLLSLAVGPNDAMGQAVLAARRSGRESERWALLWWTATVTPDDDLDQVEDAVGAFGVVLDRTHLDAAVAGLRSLPELIRDTFRQRQPYVPLDQLLIASRPPDYAWPMTPAARLSPTVRVEVQAQAPLTAELLFMGPALEDPPSGLATLSWPGGNSLLITGAHGVAEIGGRGVARWRLKLSGCHGTPVLQPDDALLVMCGPALVRWHDGALTVLAGAFEEGSQLLTGPGGEPWVLSGSGVTFGAGDGTLALTRVGSELGDQLRYPIAFEAAVHSAVWLDGRRFFLAASGSSTVVDLGRSTDAGRREDWIPTAGHYPAHLLTDGRGSVLSASPDGSGNHVLLHRTLIADRSSETVADLRLAQVLGLAQADSAGEPVYLLASLPDNSLSRVRPVVVKLTAHKLATESAEGNIAPAEARAQEYGQVSGSARGEKKDYRLERLPLAEGGQAEVFRAMHKASRVIVAFKRRLGKGSRERRRMAREIELAQRLGGHPHVMPVLDFSPDHAWFVMPMAQATAEDLRSELQEAGRLRALVDAVALALAAAHEHGWLHRDIKPSNILFLEDRWVLADWGIVRRPRGQTSDLGVLTNGAIGTEGFAAPELFSGAHEATFASDIYSLGQVIGWVLTGTWPQPNVPLLPPPGPWYGIVRRAAHRDPEQRPQDITAFLDLVEKETAPAPGLPILRGRQLLEAASGGDGAAADALIALAADRPGDYELYLEAVTALEVKFAGDALLSDIPRAVALVKALAAHVAGDERGQWPRFGEADQAIWWLLRVASLAGRERQWELLDAATDSMCAWDGAFDQWKPQDSIRRWLRSLDGQAATVVASVLRQHPNSACHFQELKNERGVEVTLRGAIHAAVTELD